MRFPQDFYQHLEKHTLTGVKGGTERETFLYIWLVAVDGRIFARSWNKSKRSWFTAFQKTGTGEIKYGEKIIRVSGEQIFADDDLTRQINKAYLQRYSQPENIRYAEGITQPEYENYTMEFFFEKEIQS
ncbi:DUF2255 family protein [Maribellus comscasis]|uniref:DUF2255 family protein n=1 Tax=Maribellus comscasis TaxID=2681766 RepID=A0A6I6JQK3_9BACT|nr:DUF2255 family protein [Maribellus comscasis]QGY43328.1 DUF2255 family protein [Maribellus comscasis]